jgi:hypothetical protein
VHDSEEIFLHIEVYLFYIFPTPPIKLKLGLQIGGKLLGNSKPPRPIIMINKSEVVREQQQANQIYYTLLKQVVVGFRVPFIHQPQQGVLLIHNGPLSFM